MIPNRCSMCKLQTYYRGHKPSSDCGGNILRIVNSIVYVLLYLLSPMLLFHETNPPPHMSANKINTLFMLQQSRQRHMMRLPLLG